MLELKNNTKSFGDTPLLNGISLTLDKAGSCRSSAPPAAARPRC